MVEVFAAQAQKGQGITNAIVRATVDTYFAKSATMRSKKSRERANLSDV